MTIRLTEKQGDEDKICRKQTMVREVFKAKSIRKSWLDGNSASEENIRKRFFPQTRHFANVTVKTRRLKGVTSGKEGPKESVSAVLLSSIEKDHSKTLLSNAHRKNTANRRIYFS